MYYSSSPGRVDNSPDSSFTRGGYGGPALRCAYPALAIRCPRGYAPSNIFPDARCITHPQFPASARPIARRQRMSSDKIRRQVACDAARLMYEREETEYFRAKLKAARRITRGDFKPSDLPSNREIRDQIQVWAQLQEGQRRTENLRDMRLEALRIMRILRAFRPRLIGSTLTGHVRRGSDIDLHVFSDSVESVAAALDAQGLSFEIERKQVRKHGEKRVFVHIHVVDHFPFELTIYASDKAHYVFKSSITGKAIERASIAELEQRLAHEYPD